MPPSAALASVVDIESFIDEYFGAWGGTDEDRILSYYAENATVQIPGVLMQGRSAIREQFVRPFITAFPGNRHVVRNRIFGRDVVVVEWTFEARHKGPFEGRAASDARIEAPGCGVYEFDRATRQISAARIYLDMATLHKQILDQCHASSRTEEAAPALTDTFAATGEHLDLATVIAVSQAVSGEMVLEKLLDTLMRTAVEHAKAERALLILAREDGQRIAAEATTRSDPAGDKVSVRLCDDPVTGSLLPEAVLRHVLHTRESVILDDADSPNPFSMDPYIAQRHARSVFCLPLMNQAKFIGVLYLENDLAPGVFAPARTAVLKLLASQAAISLENSRLYRDIAERLTEHKRAQDALNRAGAELARVSKVTALSALTASIAHEVNQPLAGIITNASTCLRMLDAAPPNIEGARETVRRTIRDGNRAADVIARLRALFSKRGFTLESLDLNDAAREVIALSSNDLQRNHVVLEAQLGGDLPPVRGDRIQLQQVIVNLLRNACEAMVEVEDRPRALLIRTGREAGERVRLSIRDSGVGLSTQSLASLFDAFYTTKSGGMGIGLFVSRSIIERHHGRLWAEQNEGAPGATFAFSIPLAATSCLSSVSR